MTRSKLVYMQARYYDPKIGRFLSPDPVTFSPSQPQFFNRYWYAQGNPYKYTDPDGRCPECLGALIGGGLELAVQLLTPQGRAAYATAGKALLHGNFSGAFKAVGANLAKVGASALAGAVGAGIAGKIGEVANLASKGIAASTTQKLRSTQREKRGRYPFYDKLAACLVLPEQYSAACHIMSPSAEIGVKMYSLPMMTEKLT